MSTTPPDSAPEPFPDATVSEEEVSIRRAPKVPVFLVLGGLIGGIVTIIVTSLFEVDPKIGYAATVGYFLLYGVPIGVVLGALIAIVLDRASTRRARRIVMQVTLVDALPDPAEDNEIS